MLLGCVDQQHLKAININKTASHAGTSARTCEENKATKHFDLTTNSEGVFVRLVVESLVVWLLFAKKTLKAIESRTAVKSSLRECRPP